MMPTSAAFWTLPLPLLLLAGVVSAECANKLTVGYPAPKAADGWSYRLVANGLSRPRGILFDNDGGLLVVDSGVGLVHLALNDDDGETCVSVAKKTTLLESRDPPTRTSSNITQLNHGIALSADGKTLYASSATNVYQWSYDSRAVRLDGPNRTIVTNMSGDNARGHTTRTLLLSRKQPRALLVSLGSASNKDLDAQRLESGRSQIRSFDLDRLTEKPYDYTDGHVVGWGLRNSVGVAEDPRVGGLWSVENSADELRRRGRDIHADDPAEELNYHGRADDVLVTSNRTGETPPGANHGYPVCYTVWGTDGFPELGSLTTGSQFADDSLYGDDKAQNDSNNVTDAVCNERYAGPRLAFQAHAAPLDIKFDADGAAAYISFHGSWNRDRPTGYRIARVAFNGTTGGNNSGDYQPVAAVNSTDAAVDVLTNPDLARCPDSCFRPVGLAWDGRGRLWFSSDSTGEIFVMRNNGRRNGESAATSFLAPRLVAVAAVAVAIGMVFS